MSPSRPTPFDLVFHDIAQEAFPRIRMAMDQAGHDFRDRDRFLMEREVVTLLRDLRPEQGLGEGIDQLAALIHHAYLFWQAGEPVVEIQVERLMALLAGPSREPLDDPPAAFYAMSPERKIWAQVIPGQSHEPLDGCFVHVSAEPETLRVLGVFGIHPEREGFSVVEAVGPRPAALVRPDGSRLFSPTLPGGAAAGLFSLTGEEELLDFGWRIYESVAGSRELRGGGSELGVGSSPLSAPSS